MRAPLTDSHDSGMTAHGLLPLEAKPLPLTTNQTTRSQARDSRTLRQWGDTGASVAGTALSSSRDVAGEAMEAVRRVRQRKGSRSIKPMKMMQRAVTVADVEPASRRNRLGDPGLGIAHGDFEALAFGKTGGDRRRQ